MSPFQEYRTMHKAKSGIRRVMAVGLLLVGMAGCDSGSLAYQRDGIQVSLKKKGRHEVWCYNAIDNKQCSATRIDLVHESWSVERRYRFIPDRKSSQLFVIDATEVLEVGRAIRDEVDLGDAVLQGKCVAIVDLGECEVIPVKVSQIGMQLSLADLDADGRQQLLSQIRRVSLHTAVSGSLANSIEMLPNIDSVILGNQTIDPLAIERLLELKNLRLINVCYCSQFLDGLEVLLNASETITILLNPDQADRLSRQTDGSLPDNFQIMSPD